MSISKRLFIGNVHPDVQESDLKSRFSSFGQVGDVEKRSKNDDHFAFMNMVFEDIHAMRNCVDALNNTRWKGLTLKVQYAKESFLEKLKRERAQNQQPGQTTSSSAPARPMNGFERRSFRPEKPKRPDNFDFEIVGSGEANNTKFKQTPKPPPSQVPATTKKLQEAEPKPPKKSKFVLENEHGFRSNLVGFDEAGIVNAPHVKKDKVDFITVKLKQQEFLPIPDKRNHKNDEVHVASDLEDHPPSSVDTTPVDTIKYKELTPAKKTKQKKQKDKLDDSDSEDSTSESSDDEKDGIPRFRGLASFGESLISFVPPPIAVPLPQLKTPVPSKPVADSFPSPSASSTSGFKLKLNPNKKAKSDEIRMKSLSAREQQLNQRSNLIRHSLSKIDPPAVTNAASSTPSKDSLFADDPEAQDEEISFDIKPQYEGASGQKMLKLKGKFGNDSRFQLDERFGEPLETSTLNASEKNLQLGILEELVGPTAPAPKPKPESNQLKRFKRFDPTLLEHQKLILNPEKFLTTNAPGMNVEETVVNSLPKKQKLKQKEQEKAIADEKAKLRDPTAKSTFKVAENIKTLFSKEAESVTGSSFSILKTFGSDITAEAPEPDQKAKRKSDSTPRADWKKNPFKYDSSDDDEEIHAKDKNVKKLKKLDAIVSTPTTEVRQGPAGFFKKESFFFTPKDERLKGIFEEFLKSNEDQAEVSKAFNESGRQELKAIAQSKMKNAKRKGEKKVNFMKLVRKKKKRETLAKQKKYEERRAIIQSKNQE